MVKQTDATFQEVFSLVSLTNSIKLLSWCVSPTVPLCYMSGTLATIMQQDEEIPTTTNASELEGSPAAGPSSSPTHPPGIQPLPVPPLLDIPFVGTPPVRCLFAEVLAIPTKKTWDCCPSSRLSDHCDKGTCVNSQEVDARSEHSCAQSNEDMPELELEAGSSFNQQQGQEPISPPSSPTRATSDPDDGTVVGSLRSPTDQASSDSDSSGNDVAYSDMDTASGDCITC